MRALRNQVLAIGLILTFLYFSSEFSEVAAQEIPIPIEFDRVITGELTAQTPEVRYTFEGIRGDVIAVEMLSIDRSIENKLSEPVLKLLNSSFDVIADSTLTYTVDDAFLFIEIPENGRYFIVATNDPNVSTRAVGQFTLTMFRIPELKLGDTVEDEISADKNKYYIVRGETPFFIYYERISGDFSPEITINQVLTERGSLKSLARASGTELTETSLGRFQPETLYVIHLAENTLDFQFGFPNTIYRLSVSPELSSNLPTDNPS